MYKWGGFIVCRFQEMTVRDQISNGHYDPVSSTGILY